MCLSNEHELCIVLFMFVYISTFYFVSRCCSFVTANERCVYNKSQIKSLYFAVNSAFRKCFQLSHVTQ